MDSPLAADQAIQNALNQAIDLLVQRQRELAIWDKPTKADFLAWFGTVSDPARREIQERIRLEIVKMKGFTVENFVAVSEKTKGYQKIFAQVTPDRRKGNYERIVEIGPQFKDADETTRAGTLIHELSHFWSVQETEDVQSCKIYRTFYSDRPQTMEDCAVYEYGPALMLARRDPKMALMNADNFEFFVERHDPNDP